MWALVSLTTVNKRKILTLLRADLLKNQDDRQETGYTLFPKLKIRESGKYYIKIFLIYIIGQEGVNL